MDFKKILIAGVVIAGAWYLYNKSKKGTTTSTDGTASGINGAQYLYESESYRNASGEFTVTGRCYCGVSNTPVAASSATDCQSKCGGQGRWVPNTRTKLARR